MPDKTYARFDSFHKYAQMEYMEKSLKWLSLKPELLKDVSTDQELIERVKAFAKTLYEFNPQEIPSR